MLTEIRAGKQLERSRLRAGGAAAAVRVGLLGLFAVERRAHDAPARVQVRVGVGADATCREVQ